VTIKFVGSDLTIQGHKNALIVGSAFFGDHFYQVAPFPASDSEPQLTAHSIRRQPKSKRRNASALG